MALSLVGAILILGVLIALHELGHYIAGRALGLPVIEFALGFGPKLFGWRKNGIDYSLRAFPLGGFCAFAGEDSPEEEGSGGSVYDKAPWRRLVMQVSGPAMNLLAGFLAAVVFFVAIGPAMTTNVIKTIEVDSAAAQAGLLPGDEFLSVDGRTGDDMFTYLQQEGGTVYVTINRAGEKMELPVTTFFDEDYKVHRIGIQRDTDYVALPIEQSVPAAFTYSTKSVGMMLGFLKDLVTGKGSVNDVSGVVGAVAVMTVETSRGFAESAKEGFAMILSLFVLISINLGVFNLLPLPALDGGRIVFSLIEIIFRRPVPRKIEGVINGVGLVLLLGLMGVMVVKDVFGLVTGSMPL